MLVHDELHNMQQHTCDGADVLLWARVVLRYIVGKACVRCGGGAVPLETAQQACRSRTHAPCGMMTGHARRPGVHQDLHTQHSPFSIHDNACCIRASMVLTPPKSRCLLMGLGLPPNSKTGMLGNAWDGKESHAQHHLQSGLACLAKLVAVDCHHRPASRCRLSCKCWHPQQSKNAQHSSSFTRAQPGGGIDTL